MRLTRICWCCISEVYPLAHTVDSRFHSRNPLYRYIKNGYNCFSGSHCTPQPKFDKIKWSTLSA